MIGCIGITQAQSFFCNKRKNTKMKRMNSIFHQCQRAGNILLLRFLEAISAVLTAMQHTHTLTQGTSLNQENHCPNAHASSSLTSHLLGSHLQ